MDRTFLSSFCCSTSDGRIVGQGSVLVFYTGRSTRCRPDCFRQYLLGGNPLIRTISCLANQGETEPKIACLSDDFSRLWFISSYLYLFIEGENIPWWIYAVVTALLGYASFASYRNIQSKLKQSETSR